MTMWLGNEDCHEVKRVGAKAANRVPPRFCISPDLYVQWVESRADGEPGKSPSPKNLVEIVTSEYRELSAKSGIPESAVALRSSALDEDGSSSSFVGQYDTYLNIKGNYPNIAR